MRERHLCTSVKLTTNSFCWQREGLEGLIEVTLLKKKNDKKSIFCKTFFALLHLFTFEVTFIETSNSALCR